MKQNCIEMNYNNNCIFGDTTGQKECTKFKGAIIGREKPCESCEVTIYYWELKNKEIAERKRLLDDMYRFGLK